MKESEKEEYINYRLEKAHETLRAAKILVENKLWNSVVNRLYYASFYAINSLLLKSEIISQTHSNVKSQFSLNFIKTGLIDKKYGKLYSDLFDWRQKGDYNDFFDLEEEAVVNLIEPVEELIKIIEDLIKK